jgi:hypothetical protein
MLTHTMLSSSSLGFVAGIDSPSVNKWERL